MFHIPDHLELLSPDKKAVLALLSEDERRRFENWVRWDGGMGVSIGGRSSFLIDYGTAYQTSGYNRELESPIMVSEAQLTQRAIESIEDKYGQAVIHFWKLGCEASFVAIGVQLGCTDKTAKERVIRGNALVTPAYYALQREAPDRPREMANVAGQRERPRNSEWRTVVDKPDSEI